jgi:hypothetical protein
MGDEQQVGIFGRHDGAKRCGQRQGKGLRPAGCRIVPEKRRIEQIDPVEAFPRLVPNDRFAQPVLCFDKELHVRLACFCPARNCTTSARRGKGAMAP